jgi:arylsulfatase A-like enzyme
VARIISTLKDHGKYDSTLIIVSAKHGQSPINPIKVNKAGHFADLVGSLTVDPADVATQQIIVDAGNCGTGPCGFISDDDIALIWLPDQSKTKAVADFINRHAKELFVDEVLAGNELKLKFNDPATDARTPDIIVQPQYGTIYTKPSKNKNAEHGGFSFGDTNVGLIVSNPEFSARVVKTPVASSQVAPTILQALGLNPNALNSVRVEHTDVLPGLPH